MTDQKYEDLMSGGWSYPKKESTDPEEVKKVVDKYLTDNKIDSETIDKKITDGVSKIVADAPEDFDTLKEMSDWISQHSDSAAAMNSDILDNKSSIESLQKDKANATEVETLSGEVENNTNDISVINDNLDVIGKCIHQKGEFHTGMGINNGTPVSTSNYDCYWMIPIEPNTNYYNTMNRAFYWYDENKTFIRSTSDGLPPSNARYLSIDFKAGADVKVYKGLYADSISDINDSLSVLGKCKNLLKPTLGSGTGNGITYVNNGDGSFTLSGTCTNTFELHFNSTLKLPYGKYKLLGTSAYQKTNNGEWRATVSSGEVFEVSESKPVLDVMAYIRSGSVVNETIKPMVTTNLNATVDDFVPYTGDGDTLTADVAKVNERTSLNVRLTLEKGDLDENGIPVSSTEYKRTINYIKVKPNTVYTISRSSTSNLYVVGFQAKGIAITDGTATNNKFIVYESTRTNVSFITTNTTQYIKVVMKNLDLSEKISLDLTNSVGETVADNMNNIDDNMNIIDDINSSMSDYGFNNVFDGKIYENFYYRGSDGALIGGSTNGCFCNVNKINAKLNDLITLTYSDEWSDMGFGMYKSDGTYLGNTIEFIQLESNLAIIRNPYDSDCIIFNIVPKDGKTVGKVNVYINNQIDVVNNDKEDKYTLELNNFTNCVNFENVVNTDEYFEAMVFDRSDKKKYIKVSGYRPSENAEENEISYINLGSKTLNIVGSNNQVIMFSGGSEMYDAYIKAIR